MTEKSCTIYIQQHPDFLMSAQEIEKTLKEGKVQQKVEALKALIVNIIHDDSFPRMVMTVINVLVPLQSDTHNIKKVLLYYWEIIEKVKNDGELRDEMILVCNSIRKDLLHSNEWVRGRTLRLVSRIMYRGVLEPLASAILENLEHKHVYVRRNAIVAMNRIYVHFGEDIISDIDESMEKILRDETDLSTKRNAFQLLFYSNQGKALEYLNSQIKSETAEDMGDILQLAVLELFRKTCKFDPSQKSRLLKAVFFFSKSKSSSVQLECANTLVQISNSNTTLKLATQIYLEILLNVTDNNVKMIVLDKINEIQDNNSPKFLEEQVIDITKVLNNQSYQIRKKSLNLIEKLTNQNNIQEIFQILVKEVKQSIHSQNQIEDYLNLLFGTIIHFTAKFGSILSEEALNLITENLITNSKIDDKQSAQIKDIIIIIAQNNTNLREQLLQKIINRFFDIQNIQLFKGVLWLIGEYAEGENINIALQEIKKAIGSLPIQPVIQKTEKQDKEVVQKKTKIKTVILPDGSYGQEVVEVSDIVQHQEGEECVSQFRELIINNSYLASAMSRTIMKLLYRIRENRQLFNKHSSESLLIFCSLLRYYAANINKVDQDAIEKLNLGIRLITNPVALINSQLPWLVSQTDFVHPELKLQQQPNQKDSQIKAGQNNVLSIAKQADDIITIRGLKGKTVVGEIDLDDEEQNENENLLKQVGDDHQDFVSKLTNLVQLTGFSDPIYAEAFVNIHKYDISFEVLLVNRTSKFLQNISVEFNTQGELRVLEKASPVNLQPNQSVSVKTSIKFSSQDIGLIFGNINYENSAGKEQAYLITKEINIDLIDFIQPADINIDEFRLMWAKYEWENRISLNTNIINLRDLVDHFENQLKIKLIGDKTDLENSQFICANFYAQTKLDDDFLVNLSSEIKNDKILGYVRIRAKNKGIVVNLGEKIKLLQNKIE